MRTRDLTLAALALAGLGLAACVAPEQRSAADTSVITSGPLAIQSAVAWPPQAVANQPEGQVPDFKAKNEGCLDCHKDILEAKSARPDVANLHVRHLDSKKIAYKGENRDCLACHEMVTPVDGKARKKEGWFAKGDVYHPNVLLAPGGLWKKTITRPAVKLDYASVEALRTSEPYIYKPTLKRLVCAECHGSDSKIKTLYGAPAN
jgi:cytochrome c553